MFYLMVNFISHEGQAKRILAAFAVGLFGMSVYGIVEFFMAGGSVIDQWSLRTIRADSLASEYHWFSTYLLIGLPIVGVWAWFEQVRLWRILLFSTCAATLFALFLTYTRGAWLAVAIQTGLLVMLTCSRRLKLVIGGAAILALTVFAAVTALNTSSHAPSETVLHDVQGSTTDLSTAKCRLELWTSGIHDIGQRPIAGWGYGQKTFFQKYRHTQIPHCLPELHNIHSSYLSFAFGAGIPALGFFVWVLYRILHDCWAGFLRGVSEFQRHLALAILLVTVGLAVRISFDVMFLGMLAVLFWMLVGLFFGVQQITVAPSNPRARATSYPS